MFLLLGPIISLLKVSSKDMLRRVVKDLWTKILTAVLSVIAKKPHKTKNIHMDTHIKKWSLTNREWLSKLSVDTYIQ